MRMSCHKQRDQGKRACRREWGGDGVMKPYVPAEETLSRLDITSEDAPFRRTIGAACLVAPPQQTFLRQLPKLAPPSSPREASRRIRLGDLIVG